MVVLRRERAMLWHLRVLGHYKTQKKTSKREEIKQRLKTNSKQKREALGVEGRERCGVYIQEEESVKEGLVKEFWYKQ